MNDVTIAGTKLPHYHICALFSSREEEYEVLGSFIREGILSGEKALHITDPQLRSDHLKRLGKMGVPTSDCERTGQLEVVSWEDAYLRGGKFDPETMLALVEEVVKTSTSQGFPRVRFMGHMEWTLEDRPGVDRLIEYEARVNNILNRMKQPAICIYDLNKFSGSAIVNVLRTHPYALLGGVLRENPFYVPLDEFLGCDHDH